jgi:hypothetical protein
VTNIRVAQKQGIPSWLKATCSDEVLRHGMIVHWLFNNAINSGQQTNFRILMFNFFI